MSDRRATLVDARVAVISSSLDPGANEVWNAASRQVGELLLIGGRHAGISPAVGERALREIDGGRGLIYRHLVGLRRVLRAFRPDLVHVNGETWALTVQELLTHRAPVVVHGAENRWDHGGGLEQAVRRRLVARAVSRMAGYASWNHAGADHLRELARRSGRDLPTLVLPAIIPPSPFRQAHWEPPPLEAERPVDILLVGQIIAKKGFADVLEASALIGRPVRLTLCGRGGDEQALRAQARRLGLSLTIKGWIDPPELASDMSHSHLLIQPSRTIADWSEQFGRGVAEAMAVGLPCLVSDSGELPVLVGQDASAIFPEGDAEALADRMRRVLQTPARLAELSAAQSRLAERYEPSRAGDSLTRFWAGLLR